jgi:hypothetical protein
MSVFLLLLPNTDNHDKPSDNNFYFYQILTDSLDKPSDNNFYFYQILYLVEVEVVI